MSADKTQLNLVVNNVKDIKKSIQLIQRDGAETKRNVKESRTKFEEIKRKFEEMCNSDARSCSDDRGITESSFDRTSAWVRSNQTASSPGTETVVLDSSGITPERTGGCLGEFRLEQREDGEKVYRQRSTVQSDRPCYLYKHNGEWWVGSTIGKAAGWLKNPADTLSPPTTGWLYDDGTGT